MSAAAARACPGGCGETVFAHTRFCWGCQAYVDDLDAAARGEKAPATVVDPLLADMTEAEVRRAIKGAFQTIGWDVLDLEQGPRLESCPSCQARLPGGGNTRVDAGLSDLILLPPGGGAVFCEIKRPLSGKKSVDRSRQQRPDQVLFQRRVEALGHTYILLRSVEEALAWTRLRGRA